MNGIERKIAVLLTVHNRKEKTLSCLDLLYTQEKVDNFKMDVFMTDDGCTDGTLESVIEKYPTVKVISGDGTLFWNRGMYQAWLEALNCDDYDFILWLNDDTKLITDSIKKMLYWSSIVNDNSIIVGSTLANEVNRNFSYGGKTGGIKQKSLLPDQNKLKECVTFNGNIVLIPKSVYKKIGIIDPTFHHSFGDVEYGFRATKNGLINYLAPGYYGYCERNNPIPLFRRKCYPIFKRFKLLYSPLGYNPIEAFQMNKRYFSLFQSLCFSIKLHFNVLFSVDHNDYE